MILERPEAPSFPSSRTWTRAPSRTPWAKPASPTCSSTWPSRARDKIGTSDYAAEKARSHKVEKAYAAYIAERDKRVGRDEQKLKQLEEAWKDAIAEAAASMSSRTSSARSSSAKAAKA